MDYTISPQHLFDGFKGLCKWQKDVNAVWKAALEKAGAKERKADRGGNKNRQRKYLYSCQCARTTDKLLVIKVLTASDSDIALFCSGPITALTGIQNRPGCHVVR